MNYRHIYHAGNFADVFKHIALITLLDYLALKPTPFCYLETHAGMGLYNLASTEAKKTVEADDGIRKIYSDTPSPKLIQTYLDIVRKFNTDTLLLYPGSPLIAQACLRNQDRMVLSELHPNDYRQLKRTMQHDRRVAVHLQNGYLNLKAFLPPKEKRGLVLIDPPYETGKDFKDMLAGLKLPLQSWPQGMYASWYPIKASLNLEPFFRELLKSISNQSLLTVELCVYPKNSPQTLNGSGLAIINPPWQLDATLKESLNYLREKLSTKDQGEVTIKWLKKG